MVDGIEVYESNWNQTQDELGPTAAFDLQCDRAQLHFTLIRREGRAPVEVGVAGCGQRGRYSKIGQRWFSASQAEEAALEQERLEAEEAEEAERQRQQQQNQQPTTSTTSSY